MADSLGQTWGLIPTSTTTSGAVEDYALVLRKVDPRTLAALRVEGEIGVGEWFPYAVDHDRRFLAVLSGSESCRGTL